MEALYESSVRKLGWRFTARLPYRTAVNWPEPGPAKIRDFGRHSYVFNDLSYYELLVWYIQMINIILKFDFVWLSSLVVDQTSVKQPGRLLTKMLKKWWNFRIFMKISNKNSWISKFIFEELPMEEISRIIYKWGDLLYEFPAETRLTVYRRLDILNRIELAGPGTREHLWILSSRLCSW